MSLSRIPVTSTGTVRRRSCPCCGTANRHFDAALGDAALVQWRYPAGGASGTRRTITRDATDITGSCQQNANFVQG